MKPTQGKIFVKFSKQQMEDAGYLKAGKLKLIVANPANPNDYSVEVGVVHDVNRNQKFFRPGDLVLVHCMTFTDGKYDRVASPTHRVEVLEGGDEVYWAYDGSGSDLSDVYARFKGSKLELLPGYVLIEQKPANEFKKVGSIFAREQKAAGYWTTLLGINPQDQEELGLREGDRIMVAEDVTYTVKTPEKDFSIVRTAHILLKQD